MKRYLFGILLCLFASVQAWAQKPRIIYTPPKSDQRGGRTAAETPTIRLDGQQVGNTVKLRWMPVNDSTGVTWQQGISNGYVVKKKTYYRNGQFISNPSFVTLATVTPAAQNSAVWADTTAENGGVHRITKKILYDYDDLTLDERYPYFVWGTTYSYAAAVKGGIGYTDTSLQTGDSCVYVVQLASISSNELKNKEALRVVAAPATPTLQFLAPPQEEAAAPARRYVRITSVLNPTRNDFVSYWIERSSTSSPTYARINASQLTVIDSDDHIKPELTYNDTVAYNRETYNYRVVGKTIFDEVITSAIRTEKAKIPLSVYPIVDSVNVFSNRTANVYWHYQNQQGLAVAQPADISAQFIQRSPKADTLFVKDATPGTISVTDRLKQISGILDNEYFRIGVVGLDGDTLYSTSMLGQYVDKTPPGTPMEVSVKWDNAQKKPVLSWKPNSEPDLAGYRVFRKNSQAEEPVQITPFVYVGTISGNRITYTDTTKFRVTGMELKYFIAAEDKKGNLSGRTTSVSVIVPDLVAPSAPAFVRDSVTTTAPSVYLSWRTSSSPDVRKHTLYRAVLPDSTFFVKTSFTGYLTEYTDPAVELGKRYIYALVAEDTTDLSSDPALRIVQMPNPEGKAFKSFTASYQLSTKSVNLQWAYPVPGDVATYEIYRAEAGARPTTWVLVRAPSESKQDEDVKVATGYKYQIRAILKTGALTPWSTVEVTFPANLCLDGQASIVSTAPVAAATVVRQEACEEVILMPGFEARPTASGSFEASVKK